MMDTRRSLGEEAEPLKLQPNVQLSTICSTEAMSAPRWIIVDDTSTNITYVGDSWFSDTGSFDDMGIKGPPFLSTLHGTNRSASFTFNYTGSSLKVLGTYTGTNSNITSWTCSVDGVTLDEGSSSSAAFNMNQLSLCDVSTTDGSHIVSVNTIVGTNQTFWFDNLQYIPSATVSLENKLIRLDRNDSAITYGLGWDTGPYRKQSKYSQLECNFIGVSVSWYSYTIYGNSTTATWTIDNNSPTTFTEGLVASNSSVYIKKFFETPKYSMSSHKLVVAYEGHNSTIPLNFGYFVVQNGTLPHSTASTSPSPSPSPTSPSPASPIQTSPIPTSPSLARVTNPSSQAAGPSSSSSHVAAIIGGTLGGIVLFLLIVLFLVVRRRRNSRGNGAEVGSSFINSVHSPPLDDGVLRYQTNINFPIPQPRKLQDESGSIFADPLGRRQDEQQHH